MSKDGYKSVSIDDETDYLLQEVAKDVERRTSVKLDSNHKIIKYLAKKEVAKKVASA